VDIFKFITPEIIFGQGSLSQIGDSVKRLGGTKAFIVSDPGIVSSGWIDQALIYLQQDQINYEVFYNITSNPKDYEVENAVKQYRTSGCDIVLGIGGGSSIDAAKAVALLSTNEGSIHEYEGIDKIENPLPPMIMIPTTAGTGADVSQFAMITDTHRKIKMTIISKSLVPDISITDPLMLITKEQQITAYTGMDALTHGIEAYLSIASNPLTDLLALNAIQLISSNLRQSVFNRTNLAAKTALAMASQQAGMAFSNAILGAVHAMTHPLGGLLDLPHGKINSILLPYVMEFNMIANPEKFINIATAMGEHVNGCTPQEAAWKAIHAVRNLATDIRIFERLSDLGMQQQHIAQLSEKALEDACMITNPRDIALDDVKDIYRIAL
jgi:1,3-propanediol dehydrogenase